MSWMGELMGMFAGVRSRRNAWSYRLMVLAVSAVAPLAPAQTAIVAGTVSSYGSSLTNTVGTAVDGSQNVYVATSSGHVYKETYSSTTQSYTENLLFTTANGTASGIAVDSAGANIYVGSTGISNTVVKYTGLGTSYSVSSTTFSGFIGGPIPAVDSSGNVYIADPGSATIYKETYAAGVYTQASIATGFTLPAALSVSGTTVFVSDTAAATIYELTGSGTSYTKTALTISGLTTPRGIGVDSSGNIYIENGADVLKAVLSSGTTYTQSPFYQSTATSFAIDSSNNLYLGQALSSAGTELTPFSNSYIPYGSVTAGSPVTKSIAFTATTAGTLGTPLVVTQGIPNLDFTLASSAGTCSGQTLALGSSCTVNATLNPTTSGFRKGAVEITNSSGSIINTTMLAGVGYSPLALFQSSLSQTTLISGISNDVVELVRDAGGNFFVADQLNYASGSLIKFAAGSTTPQTLDNLGGISGIAVDGAGDIFYSSFDVGPYLKELVRGQGSPRTIFLSAIASAPGIDDSLSMDQAGNIYGVTLDTNSNSVLFEYTPSTGQSVVLVTLPGIGHYIGEAVDVNGNIFITDAANNILYEVKAGSSTATLLYSGSPLNFPRSVAIDQLGNVYVVNQSNTGVLEFLAGNYSATPIVINIVGSFGITIGSDGTIYTSDGTSIYGASRNSISLSYPNTAVGQTSSSQTVTLQNNGAAPLTFSIPSTGLNPSISTGFVFNPSSTCPQLSSASGTVTLASGASCTDSISFAPNSSSTFSGTLVHTDNSLNIPGSTQIITLSGTGLPGNDTVTVSNVTQGAGITPTLTAVVSGGGAAPTGAVTFTVNGGPSVNASCSASSSSSVETCTAAYPAAASYPLGSYTITANAAADSNYNAASSTGTLIVNQTQGTTLMSATGTGTYDSPTTPVTVTIPYSGVVPPSGLITVNGPNGGTVTLPASSCTVTTAAVGGTLTCTANLPTFGDRVGSNPVTVTQAGDSNYTAGSGSGTITITPGTSPINPVGPGSRTSYVQDVTITQGTVSALLTASISYQGSAPTGAVTFTVGSGASVSASCTSGASPLTCTATYPTATLALGSYTITANEAADANYQAGSATDTLTVTNGSTAPIKHNNSNVTDITIVQGTATATLTATIYYTGGPLPTGAVNFTVADGTGGTVLASCTNGASPLSCTATYPTATLAVGTYLITATETADTNYPQGSSTAKLTVIASSTSPNPPVYLNTHVYNVLIPYGTVSSTLTAVISYTGPAPTGALNFTVAGGSGGVVPATCTGGASPITCTAPYPTATLAIGSYQIAASESADANYPAGVVYGTLTVTLATLTAGDGVTGTGTYDSPTTPVTVTIPYSGVVPPSGLITVNGPNGGTVTLPASSCTVTTAAVGGTLTCTANLPTFGDRVGSNPVTVTQAGDSNYTAGSGSGTITITPAVTAITLRTSQAIQLSGQPVTLTATASIPLLGTAPRFGSISFYNGSLLITTVPIGAGGVASVTTSSLPDGILSLTAVYRDSTGQYTTSTSTPLSQTILDFSITANPNSLTVNPGDTAKYPLTINPINGVNFNLPVTLSVTLTGLPASFLSGFAPVTVTPGTNGASSTMSIATYANLLGKLEEMHHRQQMERYSTFTLALLLLPVIGGKKLRRRIPKIFLAIIFALSTLTASFYLSGCGGGYFGPPPTSYTLTVTGTSGPLQRSTTVTLNVE